MSAYTHFTQETSHAQLFSAVKLRHLLIFASVQSICKVKVETDAGIFEKMRSVAVAY
jgi:hypothetical protein